ncbi:ATP-binding protein [uncultured Maribacter sp.]|uniref:AAA family ATPase n=1 Tax=uncultured Maribacter sp. TaxID=431308 RepID=UPI0030EB6AE5|tara:strand:- start:8250 stop:9530 length:1281 start_codon:yes stop_codon:yes gene_type:complete
MLIEFSVGNYKSIKDLETLTMHASNLQAKYPHLEQDNLFLGKDDLRLLKSKAIYGANASGKSNIYKALETFIKIVANSVNREKILRWEIIPFRLNKATQSEPTFFQIQFLKDDITYRYGFVADSESIHSEWLFKKVERETLLFTRVEEEFEYNKTQFAEGGIISEILKESNENKTLTSYLLLTFIAKVMKGKISNELVDFITKNFVLVSGLDSERNKKNAEDFIENEENKKILVDLVKAADMGISDVDYIDFNEDKKNEKLNKKDEKEIYVFAVKQSFNEDNKKSGIEIMSMSGEESKGTQKMFELAPYIINCMNNGGVLFIDEFDSRFHSLLTKKIVELFNSESNKKGQLVFITHDTNLLSSELLRRDQISFASRDKFGASHFYSLAEFKGVRSSKSYENDYIHGKFGAIPSLNDFEELFLEDNG